MNRKSILGLLLFGCLVIAGMFYGVTYMIGQEIGTDTNQSKTELEMSIAKDDVSEEDQYVANKKEESYLSANPSDIGENQTVAGNSNEDSMPQEVAVEEDIIEIAVEDNATENTDIVVKSNGGEGDEVVTPVVEDYVKATDTEKEEEVSGTTVVSSINKQDQKTLEIPERELIKDCTLVDYMAYIPEMVYNGKIEIALDIDNPKIDIDAKAAILFDAETKEVLYHKNAVEAVFPASTSKLLTSLVALDWCKIDEEVRVGNEVKMIASDSTKAYLKEGQKLTIQNLLAGMLLPSGNDAAYVIATYVGRKSLQNPGAAKEDAVTEFVRLMNEKAKKLGAINSLFKTPDGYDAIGQYTTAYDIGLIGIAASENETILEICGKSSVHNKFLSGEEVTWNNTNSLIKKNGGRYFADCIGLKTGTSTMAGRCLVSAAQRNGRKVISVVMNSTSTGRWSDSTKLLNYGLK